MRKSEQTERTSDTSPAIRRAAPRRAPAAATRPSEQSALPWLLDGAEGAPALQRKPIDAGFGDVVALAQAATPVGGQGQRQATGATGATAAAVTDNDRRGFVTDSIQFLRTAEQHYAALAKPAPPAEPFGNAGSIRRVLTGFRAMMTGQGGIVLDDLASDPQLYQALRAAYTAAVGAVLGGAAALTKRPVAELYDAHRDLIFDWAMPTQQFADISTPLPSSAKQDATTHVVTVPADNVQLELAPDIVVAAGPAAKTRYEISFAIPFQQRDGHITSFTAHPIRIRVRTSYPRNLNPAGPSGYGRGTTREDVAAGTTTLRFHEGQHGADFVRFVREHPAPRFGGRVGMPVAAFRAEIAAYRRAVAAYGAALDADSVQRTECVGTTIDDYNGQHGGGAQCQP